MTTCQLAPLLIPDSLYNKLLDSLDSREYDGRPQVHGRGEAEESTIGFHLQTVEMVKASALNLTPR